MEWKEIYKNRFATVEEAVRAIEDGDHLVFGHAAGCPPGCAGGNDRTKRTLA